MSRRWRRPLLLLLLLRLLLQWRHRDVIHCVEVEGHVTCDARSVWRVRVAQVSAVVSVLLEARVCAGVAVDGTVTLLGELKHNQQWMTSVDDFSQFSG